MISHELIRRIRRIELRTSRLVDELIAGQYRSAFKGQGIEFEEVRPYQPGDDVRAIDWKVSARSQVPYIKLFREERQLTIRLLIDVSGSLAYGSTSQSKQNLAVDIAALLAFAALKNNDKVAMMLFTDRVERNVRPATGLRHTLRLIRDLVTVRPTSRATDLNVPLEELQRGKVSSSVVFLVSDFLAGGYEVALRSAARRHDVVPVVIRDRREVELPRGGLLLATDPESGRQFTFDAFSRTQRDEYRQLAAASDARRSRLFKQLRLNEIELWAGQDPMPAFRQFLDRRAGCA